MPKRIHLTRHNLGLRARLLMTIGLVRSANVLEKLAPRCLLLPCVEDALVIQFMELVV
jgi:hypothetical protein